MKRTLPKPGQYLKRHGSHWKERAFPTLWLVTDDFRLPDPERFVRCMPRGTGVILRSLLAEDRERLAASFARICRRRGVKLLIAGDWELAAKVDAAGVHLGDKAARRGLAPGGRLWRAQRNRILTAAAHGTDGLFRAKRLGATAAVLAPIFRTRSHPGRAAIGRIRAMIMIRRVKIPVVAMGGITPAKYRSINHDGYCAIAGISFAEDMMKR